MQVVVTICRGVGALRRSRGLEVLGLLELQQFVFVCHDVRHCKVSDEPGYGEEADCGCEHLEEVQWLEEMNIPSQFYDNQHTMTVHNQALVYRVPTFVMPVHLLEL